MDKTGRTWPALDVTHVPEFFEAALTDYLVTAINEGDEVWRVFFHDAAERDRAARELRVAFDGLSLESIDIPDEDWASRSQADVRAVHAVGDEDHGSIPCNSVFDLAVLRRVNFG